MHPTVIIPLILAEGTEEVSQAANEAAGSGKAAGPDEVAPEVPGVRFEFKFLSQRATVSESIVS